MRKLFLAFAVLAAVTVAVTALAAAGFSGSAPTFTSTNSQGGGACAPTLANFSCPNNPGNGSACLANPNDVLAIVGGVHGTPQSESASVYIGANLLRDGGSIMCVMNNFGGCGGGAQTCMAEVRYNGDYWANGSLYLNQKAGTDARIYSTNGALYRIAGDAMYTWNTGSTDIETWFTGVGGTQEMVLKASGALTLATGATRNTCTLDGASPSKCSITVEAGAVCTCKVIGTAASAGSNGCAVNLVTTTLTAYSANGSTAAVNLHCH